MDTYCTKSGARYPLGEAHACATKLTGIVMLDRPGGGSSPLHENQVPEPSASLGPVNTKSKRGRPRKHPDRNAYRAAWQRDKRTAMKGTK